ncbi:MAG: stage 0 sporulation family protein [bacterium]
MENNIIEIKFKGERKDLYANPQQYPFKVGDYAIVQAEKGEDLGRVNQISPLLCKKTGDAKLKEIIRRPNKEELSKLAKKQDREREALEKCKQKLQDHPLDIKLVDCEFQFDGKKITFYFTSEKRVDFRELVKDLANVYKTRIEMRQIGVRDEAKRMGGYGVCGRFLCCTSWIKDFAPITTRAAKDQNLPMNPSKLAGLCGRLKCCLMYERDFYNQAIAKFPELAKPVTTEKGEGVVWSIDIFEEAVVVKYADETKETFPLEYIKSNFYECEHECEPPYENLGELN